MGARGLEVMSRVGWLWVLASACAPAVDLPARHTFHGSTMGTTFAVTLVGRVSASEAGALRRQIDRTLADLDGAMSTYDQDSELSRFNQWSHTGWFPLSAPTFEVFREAQQVSRLTDGAFDVTVAPLVDLWGFGPAGPAVRPPSQADVSALLADVGTTLLELDDVLTRIRKARPGVRSDLSAIAKGYAVDRVADLVERDDTDVTGYLVEVGGEVRTGGHTEDGQPWRVGIERPVEGLPAIQRVVELTDGALATSGDYRNYFEHEGRRYSHTIDPRTGFPVDHRLASVSVIAARCVRADALATALEVLGVEAGLALARAQGWAALLITREDDGRLIEHATPQFLALSPGP